MTILEVTLKGLNKFPGMGLRGKNKKKLSTIIRTRDRKRRGCGPSAVDFYKLPKISYGPYNA
jgi:hypothetical protein